MLTPDQMLSLQIPEQDAIDLLRRVRHQRSLREVDLREPDPVPDTATLGRIAATGRKSEGYVFDCRCGRGITTRMETGTCSACGRQFDVSAFRTT